MRSRLSTALVAAIGCATLAAQAPQTSEPQQPTFRAGTNYVRVDMYATRDGRPVEDLAPDEVELLEDGVAQKIEAFEHVVVRPAGPQDTRIEPNTVAASRQMAAEGRARVFVIFLDTYHTQIEGSANMRLPLVRFLDRVIGQDDLVALMTPDMAATDITFGRKTTVISNIMQQEWTWGRRGRTAADNDPKEDLYLACYPDVGDSDGIATEMKDRRRERLTLDAIEDLIVHLRGLREERKAVLTVTEGWRLYAENRRLARVIQSQGVPGRPGIFTGRGRVTTGRDTATGVDRSECEADRIALAQVDQSRRVRDITEAANRANVSFYPVYPRGLVAFDTPIGPERPPGLIADRAVLDARFDSLRELAENTDGLAIVNTNAIEDGLRRIVADLSSYYLLGYSSTNTKLDGRFRTITVRVKRPGVQVRARRGYRGLTAEDLLTATEGEKKAPDAAATSVSVAVTPRAPFRIRTSSWTSVGDAAAVIWVVGELDYAIRKELTWSAGAKADVVVVAANGTEVTSAAVDIAAAEGAFALRLPAPGGVAPGEYAVRVRVRPNAITGLPVSDTSRLIVADTPLPLGEPVMWRRGPSTGPRYLVTADPRFQRNERIRFEMATVATGTVSARMLDRLGNPMQVPVQVTERPDASGGFRWIVVDATLAPLAAGDYAIEVRLKPDTTTEVRPKPDATTGVGPGEGTQVGAFKIVP